MALRTSILLLSVFIVLSFSNSYAESEYSVTITIKKQNLVPDIVHVPGGMSIRLKVINEGSVPVEFESSDLKIEEIVYPRRSHSFSLKGLKAGDYYFFDDFRPKEMHGKIIVD
jgi:uncharacterized protein YkuJ